MYIVFHTKQCYTFRPAILTLQMIILINEYKSLGRKNKVIQGFSPD